MLTATEIENFSVCADEFLREGKSLTDPKAVGNRALLGLQYDLLRSNYLLKTLGHGRFCSSDPAQLAAPLAIAGVNEATGEYRRFVAVW